jgi:signal transduction histidine kinase
MLTGTRVYDPSQRMNEGSDDSQAAPTPDMVEHDSIASLCHDLRQPLVVAVGYVSMLEDGSFGELPDEARSVLATVAGRLESMNAIIDRIAERR